MPVAEIHSHTSLTDEVLFRYSAQHNFVMMKLAR